MTAAEPQRWTYRLEAYTRALSRLTQAVEAERGRGLNELERMGLVQAFEFTVELGWKAIGDVLSSQAIVAGSTPNTIVRAAFEHGIVADGRSWLRAVRLRNELSHMYREEMFVAALGEIVGSLHPVLARLPDELKAAA